MTPAQIVVAADKYLKLYGTFACTPVLPERFVSEDTEPDAWQARKHALWMCEEMKKFVAGSPSQSDIEKAMRWLGFVQGVLWGRLSVSIEEMKGDNR